jgi:hypothetical protein
VIDHVGLVVLLPVERDDPVRLLQLVPRQFARGRRENGLRAGIVVGLDIEPRRLPEHGRVVAVEARAPAPESVPASSSSARSSPATTPLHANTRQAVGGHIGSGTVPQLGDFPNTFKWLISCYACESK